MGALIDWADLLNAQKELDLFVFKNKGLTYQDTSKKRLLSLIVELSELSNETKVFKFWSEKGWDEEKVLSEYADVLHFVLSIFQERGFSLDGIGVREPANKKDKEFLTDFFLMLHKDLSSVICFDSSCAADMESSFRSWVQKFIDLSSYLGFSWDKIMKSFLDKRNVNWERQRSGY
ncbi:dUTP diphosphatase [Candidatus Mycoplasma haematohominis]|uniref:dUTPase n=1 Tax=Candidatus Mycoplasma haematohominis TaxID=1494318 RepID=A0A478FRR8_9MOLU|nr:dUTP diphosphatase [Candidatus Mycoplasma haemohominis]GCE63764.1 dUTPase [Candidatus Mycoplasma haemohominis]